MMNDMRLSLCIRNEIKYTIIIVYQWHCRVALQCPQTLSVNVSLNLLHEKKDIEKKFYHENEMTKERDDRYEHLPCMKLLNTSLSLWRRSLLSWSLQVSTEEMYTDTF